MNIHEHMVQWHTEEGVALFRQMHIPQNAICLDFGCGYGEYAIASALARPDSTVYAIDKDPNRIKAVKEKMKQYNVSNIIVKHSDGSMQIPYPDNFADIILMYDFIHGNTSAKLPIRFSLFDEAKRVLKSSAILSIAPFECEYLRDLSGKRKKYTLTKLISEIESTGYRFMERVDGAIHFDYYHSAYHWKKLNGDMPFDYLEKGPVLNFMNVK